MTCIEVRPEEGSLLTQAKNILTQIEGVTSTNTISNAISALNDILTLQKRAVQEAHTRSNEAKDKEADEKLTFRMIENILDRTKRERQELRDDLYQSR